VDERVITPGGILLLRDELDYLVSTGRKKVIERIRNALSSEANGSESLDYLDARDDQELLERRIALLEERLASARVVHPDGENGVVDVGECVRPRDLETGQRADYQLVGPFEGNPVAGQISIDSPLGRALHGRKRGETVVVDAPIGELRFKVLEIKVPTALVERR
jgi:transcription elongation factor GreA